MDDKNVQPEAVSPEGGEVSPEVKPEAKPEGEPKEQPFSDEQEARIQQMVSQASAEATKQAVEAGRRQLQGEQDRNRNVERRARLAETRVNAYETSFKGLDEETQKDIDLARYREDAKYYQTSAQEETRRQEEVAYFQKMNDSLVDEVRTWDIDPEDKRIDFASDAPDYFTGRKRFIGSLQKIVRDKQKEAEDKTKDDFKNLESKLRKDLGLESATPAGIGGGSDSDAEFKKGLGDGSIPLNKENMARAKKMGLAK